jgi:telomere length regulation protein
MAAEGEDDVLRTCIEQLQRPIEDVGTLLRALCPPLEALNVLPTKLEQYVNARIRPTSQVTARQISRIQSAVLQHHLPVWEAELKKRHLSSALDNWLCPERSGGGKGASTIAVESYTSLASSPITESTLRRLSRLVAAYPVEVIHCVICDHDHTSNDPRVQQRWEDAVRVLVGIPAKVANAAATLELDIPPSLQYGPYLNRLCIGLEVLVHDHCCRRSKGMLSSW